MLDHHRDNTNREKHLEIGEIYFLWPSQFHVHEWTSTQQDKPNHRCHWIKRILRLFNHCGCPCRLGPGTGPINTASSINNYLQTLPYIISRFWLKSNLHLLGKMKESVNLFLYFSYSVNLFWPKLY